MGRLARVLLVTAAGMASCAGLAAAADMPLGCFGRTYDAAHLQSHQGQQVRRLWLRIEASRYDAGKIDFGMNVWVRNKPQDWRAGGRCEPGDAGLKCRPDTDGASELLVTLEGGNLRLANPGRLKIYDDVTGPDLNDMLIGGPEDSVFLLRAMPDTACKDNHP